MTSFQIRYRGLSPHKIMPMPGTHKRTSFDRDFSYPHNGEDLDGVVFKSPTMEVKWDIYAYGEWFYFVRSWTSDLIYKARYENTGAALVIREGGRYIFESNLGKGQNDGRT